MFYRTILRHIYCTLLLLLAQVHGNLVHHKSPKAAVIYYFKFVSTDIYNKYNITK